jgi:hypothetical protein
MQGSKKDGFNVTWMPSVGVGIGYQVGPRFQIGIEHKTTFTRTDLWDGKIVRQRIRKLPVQTTFITTPVCT